MANPKRTYSTVYNALKQISDEEGIDFGLGGYTEQQFKDKYFTGPGNINNLYNKLSQISDEEGVDFGLGSRGEWLGSFGYTEEDAMPKQGYKPTADDMADFNSTIKNAGRTAGSSLGSFDSRVQNLQKRQGLNVPNRIEVGKSNNLVQGRQQLNPETGQLENTYITSSGNEYENEALADMEQRQIDQYTRDERYKQSLPGQLDDAYAERDRLNQMAEIRRKQIEEERSNEGLMTRFLREAGRAAQSDKLPDNISPSADWENDREYSNIMAAIRKNNELITILEDQRDNNTNGFWHSFGTEIANGYTFSLGGKAKMDDMIALTDAQKHIDSINKKRSNGEKLTNEEEIAEAVLKNNEWDREIQAKYGDDYGAWARAGKMGANSADFMLDFLMMGGMPAGMAKGIMGAVVKGGERYLGNLATKGLGKFMLKATGATLGSMVAGAEITNTIQLGKTGSDMAKSMMGDVYRDANGNYVFGHYEEDDNGNPKFVEGGNDFFEALAEVQRSGISENASEIIGTFLPGGGKALSSAGGQLLEKLGLSKISRGLTALTGKKWFQNYNKFLETAGFNGVIGEGMEEYAGMALDALMGGDEWKKLADPRTHIDIWLGVATMSGIMNAPNLIGTGYSAAQYQRYKQATNKADAAASATMNPETWGNLRETIDNTDNANMADVAMGILDDDNLSDEAKRASMDYINNLQKMRGFSLGSIAAGKEGDESEASRIVNESYTEGYDTQDPDLMKQFNDDILAAEQNLHQYGEEFAKEIVDASEIPVQELDYLMSSRNYFTDEQIAAAADYYTKQARAKGMMEGALDRIDLQVEQANAEVRANTHQQTGSVVAAKGNDNLDYYIIGGDIYTDPQTGSSMLTGTGGAVVVRDMLGNVSVKSPQDLTVYSMNPAEELINANETVLRQQLMQQADEVYQLEDTVTLNDGEGNAIEGTVVMMPNAVDGVYVLQTPDGKALQFTADQMNRMIVAHNGMEVQRGQQIADEGQTIENQQLEQTETESVPTVSNQEQPQPQPSQGGEQTGGEAGAENGTGADEQPVSALSKIPVLTDNTGKPVLNKKGKPQYQWHKASVEDAAAALIETTGGDKLMARDTASDLVTNAKAGLEKIRKQKPKGYDPIEIAESRMEIKRQEQEQQDIIKHWQDVNQAIQKQMRDEAAARQAEIEAAKSEEQRQREAEEARLREEKQREIDRQRILEAIERDREKRNKEYQPLVDARKEMEGDNEALAILNDTEPRSLEEHVSSMIRPHSMLWQDASDSETGLQSELGLKRGDMQRMMSLLGNKESGAKPFGKVVLDIYEGLPEAMKDMYTDEDVRNTLLNLFGEGNSTRMMHLTEENRIAEARQTMLENLRREAEAENEAWAEAYHLTPEERETFEDFLALQMMDGAETEYINQIIAENESNKASEAVDMQPTSGTAGRESEGGEEQVQGESAAETAGADQEEPEPEQGAETPSGEQAVSDNNVPGRTPEPGIAPSEQLKPTDLRDAVRVESPEIGVAEANEKARKAARQGFDRTPPTKEESVTIIKSLIDWAKKKVGKNKRSVISGVTDRQLKKLAEKGIKGVDSEYVHSMESSNLIHEDNRHAGDNRGQIPLTEEELSHIVDVLEDFDDIVPGGTAKATGLQTIRYEKKSPDGTTTYYVEEIRTGRKSLAFKTAYKKINGTDSSDGLMPKTSPSTPTTLSDNLNSEGKDTNNSSNLQEKTEKSSEKSANKEPKRLVSDSRMEELKKKLRNKIGGQLNVGVDPEVLAAGAEMAVGYLERGITKFADFAKAMVEEVGDFMRPYLKSFYNAVRDMPEAQGYADQMDDYETVRQFDVHNFDKGGKVPDAITRAQQISDEQTVTRQARKIKQQHPNLFAGDLFGEQEGNTSSAAKIAAEEDKVDTNPSEAQKEAGNYQKGHIKIDGYDITIENPKGSVRRGVDANGKSWETEMHNTYGYIRGTEGVDGDHIDVFLSDDPTSGNVYVVDQVNPETGDFDEHKVLLSFGSEEEAREAYLSNYEKGWKGLGNITEVSREDFKKWIESSHRKTKPFAEYAMVKDNRQTVLSSTDKIEDVGEVIEGARKDMRRKLAQTIESATKQTLTELPFSKAYKKPDLKKAVEEGAIREKDATFYDAWFATMVNPTKPKLTQSEMRSKRWNPAFRSKLERWVDQTYDALQMLKAFIEADEAGRDNIIKKMTEDNFPDREAQLAEIEKRKEWNKDRKNLEWGDKTTPNPLWVTYEVMRQMDYAPGDKLDIPYGIVVANSTGTGYTLSNNKGERYYDLSPKTVEEAIDDIVYLTKIKRGDTDIQHPVSMFYTVPTKSEMGETGKYRVIWGSWRNPKRQEFDNKEDADAFAQKKGEAIVSPISEVVRRFGYKVMFRHPLTGDKMAVSDQEFDTKNEANAYLDENYDALNEAANKLIGKDDTKARKKDLSPDDMVYTAMVRGKDGKYTYGVLIDKQYANNFGMPLVVKEGFASRDEAKKYSDSVKQSIFDTYKSYKSKMKSFTYFDTGKDSRAGEDYRGGKDVTAEDFMNTFGFRGVQFGNWTNQRDRQMAVNQAYDSFLDLAKLIGTSPKGLSLNGELGIAFGARGSGNFAAHYEPGEIVINLTKTMGAGSLAHEWWHALDNYFARNSGQSMGMVTDDTTIPMRKELRDAYNALTDQIRKSSYYTRSRQKGDYWGRMHEVTARLLAEWVDQELKKNGELNTFLSRGANTESLMKINYERYKAHAEMAGKEVMPFDEFEKLDEAMAGSPYPSKAEVGAFSAAMRNIFDVMQERTDPDTGKTALYQKASGILKPQSEADNALRDALIDLMRNAGILVGTDAEVGQEVLDEVGSNAKTQNSEGIEAVKPQKVGDKISDKPAGSVTEDINGNPIDKGRKFFRTKDGQAYGYTYNGKIYIDPSIATSETPIHEYTHLWAEALRQKDPETWKQIVEVLKNDEAVKPFWDKVTQQYPELTDDNDIADEVMAQYSGRRGAERLREVADEVARENKGIFGKAQAVEALRRMKNVLTRFWKAVADMMGWKFTSADEVADKVLSDLLNGVNPDSQAEERETPVFVSNAMRAVEAIKQDKATPEQWLKMIEKGGGLKAGEDKWIGLSDWLNSQKDKKSLTKQEVMDYIRQNQIEIEDWNYEEFSFRHNDTLKEFNDEFRDLMAEGEEETGSVYTADHADWAFNQMKDKYGDDFEYAFDIQKNGDRWELVPTFDWNDELSGEAKYYLGAENNTINPTRMEYTTQGLDNKREIALVVPTIEPYNEGDHIHFGDAGEGRAVAWVRFGDTTIADNEANEKRSQAHEARVAYEAEMAKKYGVDQTSLPSLLMAMTKEERAKDRELADAETAAIENASKARKKVLVIDEIQSKRHQDAREKGYKGKYKAYRSADDREWLIYDENDNKLGSMPIYEAEDPENAAKKWGVPDAPFEKNWHELAMKRMLRYAAENGYDKIAWTTGEQQSERYNIGKVVDKVISYDYPAIEDPDGRNSKKIEVRLKDGNTMTMRIDQNGKVIEGRSDTEGKQLSDVVGKDLAKRIMNGEGRDGTMIWDANTDIPAKVIDGDGLRIGGEGMKGFYDQILPRFMDKYGKKWGVKTGEIDLPDLEESARKMHSIDVTPEMKESVMQGQPMFQKVGSTEPDNGRPRYQNGEDALHYAERLAEYERTRRMEAVPVSDDEDTAQTAYNEAVAKESLQRQEVWQDSMIALKTIQDAIAKETGNKATGAENAYNFENRMHGRAKNMSETYDWRYYAPMLKAFNELVNARGMTQEQGKDYLIAKSGLERNLYFAFRDAAKARLTDEINDERDSLEKMYAKGRVTEDYYKSKKAELEERERNGADDFMKQVRDSYAYQHAREEYTNGNIGYTEYLRILETVVRSQVPRKTPRKDGSGNIVSDNYYDDYAKDYSGLTETFAKEMYDEAQKVKRRAGNAVDPKRRKALWKEYDKKMHQAYVTARQVAEDAVFAAESDRKPADKLWNAINAATKRTLQISYESGMMDRKTYNKVREMFDYYIPLRGWEEDKASDVYNYMGKDNVFSPAVKKTWGRTSQSEDPLAYIGNIAVSTIIAGHRNQMKQHFLNYVMNNPTSLVSVSESWYENIAPEGEAPVWVLRSADTAGKSADEIAQIVNDFNDEMKQKQAEGRAIPVTGRLRLDVNATKGQKAEHVVEVQRAGHTYQLYINGDPKAAQALNGINSKVIRLRDVKYVGKALSGLNHAMAAFFTSKNPAFVISNLSRDLNMAGASVAIRESKEYNARFIKNVAKVLAPRMGESSSWVPASKQPTGMMPSLMRKYMNGTLDVSDETERLFKEFMEEGGETGFVNMLSVDSFKENMRKEIKRMNGSSILGDKGAKEMTVGKGLRLLGETFEFYNRCAEDATRFIVYMTSRQMGKTLEDSIADAKDVTLNFNRKGTGEGWAGLIQDFFIFVNPAIQALANMYKMATGKPLRFGAVTAGFIAGGALMPFINQWLMGMFGDDDDKEAYWNLPPWVRKNNLVMWIPGTKNFLTIPLAQEFRVFYGLGEMITTSVSNHSVGNMGLELVSSVADLIPINPTGNGGNLMVDLSPTAIQPLMQIGENIDFTGKPIWRDNQGNKFAPMYTKAYVSTPDWMVKLSEKVNDVTGGNEGKKGWVEQNVFWGDYLNNPAVWNHLLQGYFGGMYNTIAKGFDVFATAAGGEVPKIYQTPVINRFLNRPVERDNAGVLGEEYYNLINERDQLDYELRVWKKKAADGDKDAQKHVDEIMQSDDYQRGQVVSHYEKIIREMKAGEKSATTDSDKDLIKEGISNYRQQMSEELEAIGEGKDPLEAAMEKFGQAEKFAEKNKLRMRIERLMGRTGGNKQKTSEDEVEKAMSYIRDEENESRDTDDNYLMLATSEDIKNDALIKVAKSRIGEYTKEYKRLMDSRAFEKANEYRQDNLDWFKADDIIKKQSKAMKDNQKQLGHGHDAAVMKNIANNRNQMLKAIERLKIGN